MSDGSKSGISGAISTLGEAIATPVKQEVKDVLSETIQSITGTTSHQDPQEEAKKKADEEKQKQNIRQFLAQVAADQQRVAQEKKQAEQAKVQEEHQDKQVKDVKKFEQVKKSENIAVSNA